MIKCPNCGMNVASRAKCPVCGASLTDITENEMAAPVEDSVQAEAVPEEPVIEEELVQAEAEPEQVQEDIAPEEPIMTEVDDEAQPAEEYPSAQEPSPAMSSPKAPAQRDNFYTRIERAKEALEAAPDSEIPSVMAAAGNVAAPVRQTAAQPVSQAAPSRQTVSSAIGSFTPAQAGSADPDDEYSLGDEPVIRQGYANREDNNRVSAQSGSSDSSGSKPVLPAFGRGRPDSEESSGRHPEIKKPEINKPEIAGDKKKLYMLIGIVAAIMVVLIAAIIVVLIMIIAVTHSGSSSSTAEAVDYTYEEDSEEELLEEDIYQNIYDILSQLSNTGTVLIGDEIDWDSVEAYEENYINEDGVYADSSYTVTAVVTGTESLLDLQANAYVDYLGLDLEEPLNIVLNWEDGTPVEIMDVYHIYVRHIRDDSDPTVFQAGDRVELTNTTFWCMDDLTYDTTFKNAVYLFLCTPDTAILLCDGESKTVTENVAEGPSTGIHNYEIVASDTSWYNAYYDAMNRGGYLARIDSAEEYETIANILSSGGFDGNRVYLGGLRDAPSGSYEYYWNDPNYGSFGTPVNAADGWAVSYWYQGEPSFADGEITEDVLGLMRIDGTWYLNDFSDDIVGDYPNMFEGKVAYLIEYE